MVMMCGGWWMVMAALMDEWMRRGWVRQRSGWLDGRGGVR